MAELKFLKNKKIGFVGAGNMAEAIARSLIVGNALNPEDIAFFDPEESRCKVFSSLGFEKAEDNAALCDFSDVLVLAVKPQYAEEVITAFAEKVKEGTVVVSIMMGISTGMLEDMLPSGVKVVRVMPNTPMTVGAGVSAVCGGKSAGKDDLSLTIELFSCGGYAAEVSEDMMHAVTALSGSGPAYVFRFVELLAESAEKLGLSQDISYNFAKKTLIGAARLLEKSEDSATILRQKVTSPGGTTEAALNAFADNNFEGIVFNALKAAYDRSQK